MAKNKDTAYNQGICSITPPREGTGSWRVRWYHDGKQHERTFRSQALADKEARRIDADLSRNNPITPVRLKVSEVAEAYLDTLPDGTYKDRQRNALNVWVVPHIGRLNLLEWSVADSKAVLKKMDEDDYSDNYKRNIGAAMRSLITFAREKRWLRGDDDDPMLGVKYTPKSAVQGESVHYIPRDTLPTRQELEKLFVAGVPYGHWPLAWELASFAGLRWGELAALRPMDIILDRRMVLVTRALEESQGHLRMKATKNRKGRHSIYPKSLVERLGEHVEAVSSERGPQAILFAGARGALMRRHVHRRIWQPVGRAASWPLKPSRGPRWKEGDQTFTVKWTPHDLRHFAACWMLFDLKAEPAQVAFWLGHANAAFTLARYVGVRGDIVEAGMSLTENW